METEENKNKVLKEFDQSRGYDARLELWCQIKRLDKKLELHRLDLIYAKMSLLQFPADC
jgi:hypothetical protein